MLVVIDRPSHSAVLWLTPDQTDLAKQVARHARLDVVGVGSPVRGQAGAVAQAFDCRVIDDLRAELAAQAALGEARTADVVWLLTPGDLGHDPSVNDTRALIAARTSGLRIVTSEPIPASALDLGADLWSSDQLGIGLAAAVRFCPLARLSRSFREAEEILPSLGQARTILVEFWSNPRESSLGASLFSAMELVHSLMGEPEAIDAGYVGPPSASGSQTNPGETLRDLHGDLTANLRFSDGRAAAVALSDQAGSWSRGITIIANGGRLHILDDGFHWIGPDGATLERHQTSSPAHATNSETLFPALPSPHPASAVAAVADAITRMTDPSFADAPPAQLSVVLAMAQAALLSARTAQPESPATVRRMAGAS